MRSLSAISLFSGAGGMDLGFKRAGFTTVWANDINQFACETYRLNLPTPIQEGPLESHLDTLRQFSGIDLAFGGPPCQGFSVAGKMNPEDERSQRVWSFFDAVERSSPRAFVLENVKALAVLTRWSRVRRKMFERAAELGYKTQLVILNSNEFGVSQKRERMFLFGFRDADARIVHVLAEKYKSPAPSIRELFSELGRAGSPANSRTCKARVTIAAHPVLRKSPYAGMLFNGQGRPINPDGHSATLHASMGGNKTPILDEEHLHGNQPSWVEWYHGRLMHGGKPLGLDDAPERLRRLTLDEAIRIQTFPTDYVFSGGQSRAFTQIGNAVPPALAHAVANVVRDVLTGDKEAAAHLAREAVSQLNLALSAA